LSESTKDGGIVNPTLTVRVTLSVTVDLTEYREAYGEEDIPTIRESVRYAALEGVEAGLASGIANVKLV
jgi:hypothetical protein